MNIVFVSKECPPSRRSSGIGSYVWETGMALAHQGHQVTVIAASDHGDFDQWSPHPRLTIARLPDDELVAEENNGVTRVFRSHITEAMAYRRRVSEYIQGLSWSQRLDVIEFCGFRGESAAWLADPKHTPMVVRMHGFTAGTDSSWKTRLIPSRRWQVSWERREIAAADLVTVVSNREAGKVREHFLRDAVEVVYNGIDSHRWGELAATAAPTLEPDDVLFVGSLLVNKGVLKLLSATKQLRETGWRGRLILVGKTTREFDRFLQFQRIFGLKLPDWVVHLGFCERERLAGLYRYAGACCLPSLSDAFPYTCLEAMSCGAITIGSETTGMTEALCKRSGFLANPSCTVSLASALRTALSMSKDARETMRNAAQNRVHSRFSHSAVIPKLVSTYEKAISIASQSRVC